MSAITEMLFACQESAVNLDIEQAARLAREIAEDAKWLLRGYGKDKGHHCDYRAKLQMAHDRALEIRALLKGKTADQPDDRNG